MIFVAAYFESILKRRSHHESEADETVLGSCNRGRYPDGVEAETHGRARIEDKLA